MNVANLSFLRWLYLFAIFVALTGCAGSPSRLEAENTKNMRGLQPDMTTEQVTKLMGPPNKTEMYRGKKNETVLTYLYLTNGLGFVTNPENETNYTPIVFVNDRLNGWGWNQLDTAAKRYEFVIKNR